MDKISDLLTQNTISPNDIVEIHTNPSNHSYQEINTMIQKLVAENTELKNTINKLESRIMELNKLIISAANSGCRF